MCCNSLFAHNNGKNRTDLHVLDMEKSVIACWSDRGIIWNVQINEIKSNDMNEKSKEDDRISAMFVRLLSENTKDKSTLETKNKHESGN